MKRVLITGVTGQDGSYLSDYLLGQGCRIFGLVRRKADATNWRIRHLSENDEFSLINGDMGDLSSLNRALKTAEPDFVFNLAAQSYIPFSWDAPVSTANVTAKGVLNILEAIRSVDPSIRFYQASSSEVFGKVRQTPQTEETPFYPRSPYGVSKAFGHWITINYRESFNLFACSGILFNHESERRGIEFVTRKVTYAAARIKRGLQDKVTLGNLDAARDWGYAPDYIRAMWLMLNQDTPDDYVISTGRNHTVRELCQAAFRAVDLDWEAHVEVDERFLRPAEVNTLLGNSQKAQVQLGWVPETTFEEMISRMVEADMHRVDNNITWET